MRVSGIEPNHINFVTLLSGCAHFPSQTLSFGFALHAYARKLGLDTHNVKVGTAVIDMYSKFRLVGFAKLSFDHMGVKNKVTWNTMVDGCGCVALARQVFDKMPARSLISWNSIIVELAINEHALDALQYFDSMQNEGFQSDAVTFTGVLTACSHAGLVEKGLKYFKAMRGVHRITLRIEHYGCMVDLYSRAGRLEDALGVIKNMPMKPNEVILGSILAACRNLSDVRLAEVMRYIYELDPDGDSNHVLLCGGKLAGS
ncbi:hypothetical protein RND71_020764 [Anisodus tanguticus]|uniref:Pentatricopeptide repeat-containing protein n=1 Tax=Anisodus tanguticus TaxID=243964 RepID=A0AAE1RUN6_9SOLA|nr:hypothetical protein RND71_020764 [Anisodus tanguticus]